MSTKSLLPYAHPTISPAKSVVHVSPKRYLNRTISAQMSKPIVNLLVLLFAAFLAATLGVAILQSSAVSARHIDTESKLVVTETGSQTDILSLGSTVFLDINNNGLLDANESGISDISLTVYSATNTLVATATTNISGTYLITGLAEGSYYIIIQRPPSDAPTSSTITNLNDDQIDNDDNGDQPGGPGAPVISPIIGLASGVEPVNETGLGGEQDDLSDDSGDMTIDFGFVPANFDISVGDLVWEDRNQNGLQDQDEDGIPDVTVAIYDTNTGLPLVDTDGNPRTEVTDSAGNFLFTNLPPGNYYLTISDIPVGFQATRQNEGSDDTVDSDLYPNVSQTTPTGPLVDGVQYLALDSGLFDEEAGTIADIGDRVWYDYDGDGIQGTNINEYGIPNVAVTLYESANRSILQSTTTDTDGNYLFSRIPAGNYYLEFTSPNDFVIPVWPERSPNEILDSDIDGTGRTAQFTLVGGEDVWSLDAGFVLPAELEVNFWNDANQNGLRDADEAGFDGSQVLLLDAQGERLADVLTDSNGIGNFTIPPGSYRLKFVPPGGFAISPPNTSGTINNDADQEGLTATLALMPDETASGWGAGAFEVQPASLTEGNEPGVKEEIDGKSDHTIHMPRLYLPLVR